MTNSPFAKPSDLAGGSYFKPADHANDVALLVEPKSIERDVPNTYQGTTRNRDEVLSDVTVFATEDALNNKQPTDVLKSVKIVHGMLTGSLAKILGSATVAVVRKVPTQKGAGWAFRDVAPEQEALVADYFTEREAAIAEAMESVPPFDD